MPRISRVGKGGLRIHSWNVQGLGGIARGTADGAQLLKDFKELGVYDFFFLQEHKLTKKKIPFVNKRIGAKKSFWSPAELSKKGMPIGGLAILVGDRFADKVVDAGVDKENAFLWLQVVSETGVIGLVNVYTLHSPQARAPIWGRMLETLDLLVPWTVDGDLNFVERQQDKKGGLKFRHGEENVWLELRDMELAVGDPWVLRPQCVPTQSPRFSWQNKDEDNPVWERLDWFYIPLAIDAARWKSGGAGWGLQI